LTFGSAIEVLAGYAIKPIPSQRISGDLVLAMDLIARDESVVPAAGGAGLAALDIRFDSPNFEKDDKAQ
jgi:hypothetical protein